MEAYSVAVGKGTVVVRSPNPGDGLQETLGPKPVFLYKGEEYVSPLDGKPLIIAVAGERMIIAHSSEVRVVGEIIATLKSSSVDIKDIAMCLQFPEQDCEDLLVQEAQRLGLRCIWATNTFAQMPDASNEDILLVHRVD